MRLTISPSSMIWRIDMRGLSEAKGSWKTICMRERERPHFPCDCWCGSALPVKEDLAAVGRDEPDQRLAEGRLARARFADEPERLVAAEIEAELVDGDELEEIRA